MIETLIAVVSAKEFKIAVSVIKLLRNALKEDVSEVLKKKIADSELQTAQSVLDSLGLEAPENWINGINRAVSHIESAFTLYNDKNEFESSCICAMYLSVMHKAMGNNNDEFHKSIWLKVPVNSKEEIDFGKYCSRVKQLLPEIIYQALVSERRRERIRQIDIEIEMLKFVPPVNPTVNSVLGVKVEMLKKEKRSLQGIKDERSIFKKALEITFWRYS